MELNPDAVRDAVQNAKMNDVKNIQFYCNDAGRFIVNMAEKGEKVDVILMDPPEAEVRRNSLTRSPRWVRNVWSMSPAGRKHLLEIFGGLWGMGTGLSRLGRWICLGELGMWRR